MSKMRRKLQIRYKASPKLKTQVKKWKLKKKVKRKTIMRDLKN